MIIGLLVGQSFSIHFSIHFISSFLYFSSFSFLLFYPFVFFFPFLSPLFPYVFIFPFLCFFVFIKKIWKERLVASFFVNPIINLSNRKIKSVFEWSTRMLVEKPKHLIRSECHRIELVIHGCRATFLSTRGLCQLKLS